MLSPWLPADSESAGEPGVLDEAPAVTMATAAPLPPPLITDTMATALVMATPGTGSGTGSGEERGQKIVLSTEQRGTHDPRGDRETDLWS